MHLRSYIFILILSLGWFRSSFSMVKAMKWTRNEQTVFLLGAGCVSAQYVQDEWRQIDLVLKVLQERTQRYNRKIRILYEQAPAQVKAACAIPIPGSNRSRIDRFRVNFDNLVSELDNSNFILQDVATRLLERELIYTLLIKDSPEFEQARFDERSSHDPRSITMNDFIEDLCLKEKDLRKDLENIPTQEEKERCVEEIEKASHQLNFFKRKISQWFPADKPAIDFIANLRDEVCAELYEDICSTGDFFFESFIGHQIMKSNPSEDLVILLDYTNVSYQHMIGLGWSYVSARSFDYPTVLSLRELGMVLGQRTFSEKVMDQLHELASRTQQSMTTVYHFVLSYITQFKRIQEQPE